MMTDMTLRGIIHASDQELQDIALERAETVLPQMLALEREGFTRAEIDTYTRSTGVSLEDLAQDVKGGFVTAQDFRLQQEAGYDTNHWGRDLDAFRETQEHARLERNRRYVGAALTASMGLVAVGGLGAVTGVLSPGGAMAASPCNAIINITVDDGVDPIDDAYVRYIMNPGTAFADTLEDYTNEFGELTLSTDIVSAVGDVPSRFAVDDPYPNPPSSVSQFLMSTDPAKDSEKTLVEGFDLRGRKVFSGYAQDGEIRPQQELADGNYLVRFSQGGEQITKKMAVIGGLDKIVVSQSSGMNKVWSPGPDPADVLIQADGFANRTEEGVLVYEGVNDHDYDLEAMSTVPVRFRVTDETADSLALGMIVKLKAPDGYTFADTTGVDGEAHLLIPSSYAPTDSFDIFIDDTPGFSHNVYATGRWGEIAATNKLTSTDGPYCVKRDIGKATLEDLSWGPGIWLVPLSDEYYEQDEMRNMLADWYENTGVRPWGGGELINFHSYTLEYPSGNPISPGIIQDQNDAIDFFTQRMYRGVGLAMVDTSRTQSTSIPVPPEGNIFVYFRTDVGPGNIRNPAGTGVITHGSAWIGNTGNQNLRLYELGRVIGISEGSGGTNSNGFETQEGEVVGLNDLGKRSYVHSHLHGPVDFQKYLSK